MRRYIHIIEFIAENPTAAAQILQRRLHAQLGGGNSRYDIIEPDAGNLKHSVNVISLPEVEEEDALRPRAISEARDQYGSDEIEVDDGARLSIGDNGLWVAAWLWLDNKDLHRTGTQDDAPS